MFMINLMLVYSFYLKTSRYDFQEDTFSITFPSRFLASGKEQLDLNSCIDLKSSSLTRQVFNCFDPVTLEKFRIVKTNSIDSKFPYFKLDESTYSYLENFQNVLNINGSSLLKSQRVNSSNFMAKFVCQREQDVLSILSIFDLLLLNNIFRFFGLISLKSSSNLINVFVYFESNQVFRLRAVDRLLFRSGLTNDICSRLLLQHRPNGLSSFDVISILNNIWNSAVFPNRFLVPFFKGNPRLKSDSERENLVKLKSLCENFNTINLSFSSSQEKNDFEISDLNMDILLILKNNNIEYAPNEIIKIKSVVEEYLLKKYKNTTCTSFLSTLGFSSIKVKYKNLYLKEKLVIDQYKSVIGFYYVLKTLFVDHKKLVWKNICLELFDLYPSLFKDHFSTDYDETKSINERRKIENLIKTRIKKLNNLPFLLDISLEISRFIKTK